MSIFLKLDECEQYLGAGMENTFLARTLSLPVSSQPSQPTRSSRMTDRGSEETTGLRGASGVVAEVSLLG